MKSEKLIRSFVAIELPIDIKAEIYRIVNKYVKKQKFIRKTAMENYHITVKFLGNISLDQIEKVKNILSQYKDERFYLELKGSNYFNLKQPKVLWLSFENRDKRLKQVVNEFNKEMEKIGFESEHRIFIPHITIGRLQLYNKKDFNKVEKLIYNINLGIDKVRKFRTEGINLYKSTLTPKGAKYTILY